MIVGYGLFIPGLSLKSVLFYFEIKHLMTE